MFSADTDVELMNAAYTEIGDAAIYQKYTYHLNSKSTRDEFERACRESCSVYFVAFTQGMREILTQLNSELVRTVDGLNILPFQEGGPLAFQSSNCLGRLRRLIRLTALTVSPNFLEGGGRIRTGLYDQLQLLSWMACVSEREADSDRRRSAGHVDSP